MKVLLVDDEVRVVEGLQRNLHVSGAGDWDIRLATSGPMALDIMTAQPVDVVVSDIRMPGMSGDALLRRVHADWPAVVRIVLSGYSDAEASIRTGGVAHQFLTKPCNAGSLVASLQNIAALHPLVDDAVRRQALSQIAAAYVRVPMFDELSRAFAKEDAETDRVAALVRRSPALTDHIVALAVAAGGVAVPDVRAAVHRLGVPVARAVALGFAIAGDDLAAQAARCRHTVRVAALAGSIAALDQRATAFAVALLHDLGDAMVQRMVATGPIAVIDSADPEASMVAPERLPAHVGAYLLALWGAPVRIVEAVARYAGPFDAAPTPEVATVRIAEALISGRAADPLCLGALGLDVVPDSWSRRAAEAR